MTTSERGGSRRYPEVTWDTARPQGGGRTAGGGYPAPVRQWPLLTVLAGTLAGLLVMTVSGFRIGLLIVGCSVLAGGVLRLVLPAVGMLAVRSRFTDVVTYGALGTLIVLLTLMAQPDPWLELPFLKDILRFSAGD
ncbi:DUF3017 domain-containing protein [Streptomyces aidingensis]|uniref:DUF3017 domain-containing protein n=1 Tax=Streptomyces aidingensis TaxID=910347 RepID=UPI001FE4E52D|nr:DUF3017 domain-containing protein [Streptomyces aidingensis]